MQQRAGLLFLAKNTGRILLILQDDRWTVPTFARKTTLMEDVQGLMQQFASGRIVPIELYLSQDKGFEYSTYVCLVENEFNSIVAPTICWATLDYLPKQLHAGLKTTLNNQIIRTKIDTIMEFTKNATTN